MARLLVTRPRYESTTDYLFSWSKETIELAKRKGMQVLNLEGEKVTRANFVSYINKMKPHFVYLNGHGSATCVAGHNHEVLVEAGTNEEILSKKITYALSCESAKILGQMSIEAGGIAYIGYKENFYFWKNDAYSTRPTEDPRASLFLEPSSQIANSLVKGHTVEESFQKGKNAFLKNIQQLVATNSPDKFVVPWLISDMINLTYHGNGNAKIED